MKVVDVGNSLQTVVEIAVLHRKHLLLVAGVDRIYLFSSKCVVENFKDYALCLN